MLPDLNKILCKYHVIKQRRGSKSQEKSFNSTGHTERGISFSNNKVMLIMEATLKFQGAILHFLMSRECILIYSSSPGQGHQGAALFNLHFVQLDSGAAED